jgi:uncharacterized membrane protein
MSNTKHTLLLAAAAGALCGMRSMNLAAALALKLSKSANPRGTMSRALAGPVAAAVLPVLAAGELAADKTSMVPARTELPSLIGRVGMAKLCAVIIAEQRGETMTIPAMVAGTVALASTYASYHIRRIMSQKVGIPDAFTALAEDAVVVSSSLALTDAALGH